MARAGKRADDRLVQSLREQDAAHDQVVFRNRIIGKCVRNLPLLAGF